MIRTSVAVECDSCGTRRYAAVPTRQRLARASALLRINLARRGWQSERDADTCPTCGGAE